MSATDENAGQDGRGSARVVIRGVQAIVLDDLPPALRMKALEAVEGAATPQEAWIAVASGNGQVVEAIRNYAGQSGTPAAKPGKYKAPPAGSWFVSAMVIEPPLP